MNIKLQGLKHQTQEILVILLAFTSLFVVACSTNPATGESQFTALMSPKQEARVGATEHEKIISQFGLYDDPQLQSYLNSIGTRLAVNTERSDVSYTFYVLDSPIVNAFALPGGYVYVSRGLLALANNEAELAGVVGHEIGHVTARHSAERYSTGVVTSLGAALVGAAVGSSGVSQALDLGSNLFLSSYSRSQENQADTLGIRYLSRAGYDPHAMSSFLDALERHSAFEAQLKGQDGNQFNYFATHPATSDRVEKTSAEASQHMGQGPAQGWRVARDEYLNTLNGMTYGDSAAHGFVRGRNFYHPKMGFTFSVPDGFRIDNGPSEVVASAKTGAMIVFDIANPKIDNPSLYLSQEWAKDKPLEDLENITINGFPAATASLKGSVNGRPMTIRLITVFWNGKMARFTIGIPQYAGRSDIEALQTSSYSFRDMTESEKRDLRPYRLRIVTAGASDSVVSLAQSMTIEGPKEDYFLVLNGLNPGEPVIAGQRYKVIGN